MALKRIEMATQQAKQQEQQQAVQAAMLAFTSTQHANGPATQDQGKHNRRRESSMIFPPPQANQP